MTVEGGGAIMLLVHSVDEPARDDDGDGRPRHDQAEDNLDQKYLLTPPEARDSYLVQLLLSRLEQSNRASFIVFCRTCRQA